MGTNPKLAKAIDDLRRNPGTYTLTSLAKKYGLSYDALTSGYRRYKDAYKLRVLRETSGPKGAPPIQLLNRVERKRNTKNVLIIGDMHQPFTLDGYLEFCKFVYKKHKCTHVVFIGDLIDSHASSFHDHDPDGYSPGHELEKAIERLEPWIKAFPIADWVIGNHCAMVARRALAHHISSRWIRSFTDVIGAPGWDIADEFIYDDVKYVHGLQGTARNRARKDLISTVQGHRHSEAYVEYIVGENYSIFGMQVGCGIDRRAYAFAYNKAGSKPAIACGVVLDHGRAAVVEMAQLSGGVIHFT